MKNRLRVMLGVFGVLGLFAAAASAATLSSQTTITQVQILGNNAFIAFAAQPTGKQANCPGNNWATFPVNTDAGKAMLSAAQATFLGGKKIQVYWGTTCTAGNDGVNYPVIGGLVYMN
jgi:hypothetical protein